MLAGELAQTREIGRVRAAVLAEIGPPPARALRPGGDGQPSLGHRSPSPAQHDGDIERRDVGVWTEERCGLPFGAHGATPCMATCRRVYQLNASRPPRWAVCCQRRTGRCVTMTAAEA